MSSRKPFVGGNWKCNGKIQSIKELVGMLNGANLGDKVEVVVSPPSIYLEYVKSILSSPLQVSAQNMWLSNGAFTGEISGEMLVDSAIAFVILGHSERRTIFHETDDLIGKKVAKAGDLGLTVIACIGETLEQREANQTSEVVISQLNAISSCVKDWSKVVIAYEPVWAIGTGRVASPEQAQEVHSIIRNHLKETVNEQVANDTRIIYGGSVKKDNAQTLASMPDIDGFLVGGASLLPEFVDIIKSLEN